MSTKKKEPLPSTKGKQVGRPPQLKEKWTRVTLIMLNRQIAYLDHEAVDLRLETGRAVKRAEFMRALVDLMETDPTLRERVRERLSK